MSMVVLALHDTGSMLRCDARHSLRNMSITLSALLVPIINALRGLLLGTAIGDNAVLALAWCVGLILVAYLVSQAIYAREPVQ